jgi:hypothetical protein
MATSPLEAYPATQMHGVHGNVPDGHEESHVKNLLPGEFDDLATHCKSVSMSRLIT